MQNRRPAGRRSLARATFGLALVVAGLFVLVPRYGVKHVGTTAMEPAIRSGDTVVVDEKAPIRRGDLVAVAAWEDDYEFALRVAGVAGDTVVCCQDGKVHVNGTPADEPYAHGDNAVYGPFSATVPPGRLFLLAESRSVAVDSRNHMDEQQGTVAEDRVRGKIVAVSSPVWRVRPLTVIADVSLLIAAVLGILAGLLQMFIMAWPAIRRAFQAVQRRGLPSVPARPRSERSTTDQH